MNLFMFVLVFIAIFLPVFTLCMAIPRQMEQAKEALKAWEAMKNAQQEPAEA